MRCYDGHWKREGSFLEFTGRGCVKFSNGEFHDGEFVDGDGVVVIGMGGVDCVGVVGWGGT